MKIKNSFQNAARSYEGIVEFPDNPILARYSFYPENETARLTLLSAEQSGRLQASVKALERHDLLDSHLAVVWSRVPGSLLLRGLDREHRYLDVDIGQSLVSRYDHCPTDWRDTTGTGFLKNLLAVGALPWLSLS